MRGANALLDQPASNQFTLVRLASATADVCREDEWRRIALAGYALSRSPPRGRDCSPSRLDWYASTVGCLSFARLCAAGGKLLGVGSNQKPFDSCWGDDG